MKTTKRTYRKRNYQNEAKLQTDLLRQQEAREQFLMKFSSLEESIIFEENLSASKCKKNDYNGPNTWHHTIDSNRAKTVIDLAKSHIPTNAKEYLEKWMYDHRFYCYPTKAEKQQLALETNLSVQKVSNWFINSRRRMLPKLLETEGMNSIDFTICRKKKKISDKMPNKNLLTTNTYPLNMEMAINTQATKQLNVNCTINDLTENYNVSDIDCEKPFALPITIPVEIDRKTAPLSMSSKKATLSSIQKHNQHLIKGIIYDKDIDFKCLYIIMPSSNKFL